MTTNSTASPTRYRALFVLLERGTNRSVSETCVLMANPHADSESALAEACQISTGRFGPLFDEVCNVVVSVAPIGSLCAMPEVRPGTREYLEGTGQMLNGSDLTYANVCSVLGRKPRKVGRFDGFTRAEIVKLKAASAAHKLREADREVTAAARSLANARARRAAARRKLAETNRAAAAGKPAARRKRTAARPVVRTDKHKHILRAA